MRTPFWRPIRPERLTWPDSQCPSCSGDRLHILRGLSHRSKLVSRVSSSSRHALSLCGCPGCSPAHQRRNFRRRLLLRATRSGREVGSSLIYTSGKTPVQASKRKPLAKALWFHTLFNTNDLTGRMKTAFDSLQPPGAYYMQQISPLRGPSSAARCLCYSVRKRSDGVWSRFPRILHSEAPQRRGPAPPRPMASAHLFDSQRLLRSADLLHGSGRRYA